MPDAAFFQNLGVFVRKGFLDAKICSALRIKMTLSQSHSQAVVTDDGIDRVDETIRKTKIVKVDKETEHLIDKSLNAIKPEIETHFGIELNDCENLNFLVYKEGDFFKPHTDSSTSKDAHGYVQQRRVSVVIFVNGESLTPDSDSYTGGQLILYGLIKDPLWEKCGFNIYGESGLLIAFAADLFHEVTCITQGMRLSVVTWFPAKSNVD